MLFYNLFVTVAPILDFLAPIPSMYIKSEDTNLLRKGKYHCTPDILFILFGFNCFAFMFNELQFYLFGQIKTSQTVGQPCSDIPPMVSVLWSYHKMTWSQNTV